MFLFLSIFFLIPSYFLQTPLQKFWIMKLISKYILAHTVSYFPCPIFLFSFFPFFKIILSFAQTQRKGKEKCKSLCYSYNWLIQLLCTKWCISQRPLLNHLELNCSNQTKLGLKLLLPSRKWKQLAIISMKWFFSGLWRNKPKLEELNWETNAFPMCLGNLNYYALRQSSSKPAIQYIVVRLLLLFFIKSLFSQCLKGKMTIFFNFPGVTGMKNRK